MNKQIKLEMLGLLMAEDKTVDPEENPVLFNMLVQLGIYGDVLQDKDRIRQEYIRSVGEFDADLKYYESLEIQTNPALNLYLTELAQSIDVAQGETCRQMAVNISAMGNKGGIYGETDGVLLLIETGYQKLAELYKLHDEGYEEQAPRTQFQLHTHNLHQVLKALELTDVFVTSRFAAVSGVPEFPESALVDLPEPAEPDFELDTDECGDENCLCGCRLDEAVMMVEGFEDLLADRDTAPRAYMEGVAHANSLRLRRVEGQEGAVFDALKELGRKAYEVAVESLKAVKELFDEGDDQEKMDDAKETADTNKKALQSIKSDTPARINDAARKGINDLAEKIDPTGRLKNLVSNLTTPADGARVLDGMLGFMRKGILDGSGVADKIKEAQKTIDELKKAGDDADKGDEENKEVVAANKARVQEKVAEAKEALKKVKAELSQHNKWMSGLKKAIAGINPKIFVEDTSKGD
jgi:CHASE3 domain sensor protein